MDGTTQPAHLTVRGQNPGGFSGGQPYSNSAGSNDPMRLPMPVSGTPNGQYQNTQFQSGPFQPATNQPYSNQPQGSSQPYAQGAGGPFGGQGPQYLPPPGYPPPGAGEPIIGDLNLPPNFADIDAFVEEARTGRFMFGVGVNSNAGVTGQIVIDERNFDYRAVPSSFQDVVNGTAFRGAGQGFRLEAMPGTQVQRYLASFTEPYLFDTQVSMNLSGFYYQRNFFDWSEQRLGGRVGFGYRLTHDLSLSYAIRAETIEISRPRVRGVPQLEAVLGKNELYSGRVTLTHDTRDLPFAPTEGHLIELSYEQAFGDFDYPRGEVDYRRYFLIRERPDGSGRHTLAFSGLAGASGSQTPLFENYFAGGFSTLRGFDFRGASPRVGGVTVGGRFQLLGSVEYLFPLTADDMLRGVFFVDAGTVEQDIAIRGGNFRVAPGFGLRINIPALGPAPLALDLAIPIKHAPGDDIQNFSFFFGVNR
jgi:outer membrane protein insertion porin family